METTISKVEALELAAKATLLFYTVGPWTLEKRIEWNHIGTLLLPTPKRGDHNYKPDDTAPMEYRTIFDCTTKTLCDMQRAALAVE